MVSNRRLTSSQHHTEYHIGDPQGVRICKLFRPQGTICWYCVVNTLFSIDLWNETIAENMDTGPENCLIPQISTTLEIVELETRIGTESSNLIPQVGTAVDVVGLETNTGTSESGAIVPPFTTALETNTGTEPASWNCRVNDALERDDANDLSEVVCWKVPHHWRTGDDFDPQSWRFGLHNRAPDTLETDGTERFKIEVARALRLTGDRWHEFCKDVVREEKSHWEAVYGQSPHVKSHNIADIRCLLALDALFLVIWMQMTGGGIWSLSPPLQKLMGTQVMRAHLIDLCWSDFYLVENQIPMVLLVRVVGNLRRRGCRFIEAWEHEQWQYWNFGSCALWEYFDRPGMSEAELMKIFKERMTKTLQLQGVELEAGHHILDKSYRILCGDSHGRRDENYQRIPSATYLEACGVRIKGKDFTCFEDISFERGCLTIPFLRIYDETARYLRNLVVHEDLTYGASRGCARSYTSLMDNLMKTTEDIELLVKWGVIEVYAGTHDNVLDKWKTILCNVIDPRLTKEFSLTLTKVNKYVGQRRNKLRFEFVKLFCSRPWIILSVIAATLLTIATLIQTYVNVIGSNGMQPHFPPH